MINSYRGPSTERLPYSGELGESQYAAVTATSSPGNPFHSTPHVLASKDSVKEAIAAAERLPSEGYTDVEVHVLACGWGFPDLCSRIWSRRYGLTGEAS